MRGAFPAVGLGRLCFLQSGGPEAIRDSARLQGGGGAQTPSPQAWSGELASKLAFWLLSLTESATSWPQAAVQGLVPRLGTGGGRPSQSLPPAQSCYSRLYLHLGLRGRSLTP